MTSVTRNGGGWQAVLLEMLVEDPEMSSTLRRKVISELSRMLRDRMLYTQPRQLEGGIRQVNYHPKLIGLRCTIDERPRWRRLVKRLRTRSVRALAAVCWVVGSLMWAEVPR
jgi:hypothetical protein